MWSAKKIIKICGGELFSGDLDESGDGFSKDTRTIEKGNIYIGIKGDNFDGNEFYQEAFNNGASICILEKSFQDKIEKIDKTIIIVDDSIKALKNLAENVLIERQIPVIAITGSVGKTSTRDIIYSVVSQKYKALVAEKNYNNEIGLPLTVLRLKDEEIIVLELGMRNRGEIEYLSKMIKPDIAVITNVLPVHIERLGNIQNILNEKLDITAGLKESGYLIINNDNEYLHDAKLNDYQIITCGIDNDSTYKITEINNSIVTLKIKNEIKAFKSKTPTKQYILNELLALAVGNILGIDESSIQNGLDNYNIIDGRLECIQARNGINIINDAYNANAASMINGIEYLLNIAKKRTIAVLGNINELGEFAKEEHEKVGEFISNSKLDILVTIGEKAKYISDRAKIKINGNKIYHFNEKSSAKEFLKDILQPSDTVIFKASNGERFIELVNYFKEEA